MTYAEKHQEHYNQNLNFRYFQVIGVNLWALSNTESLCPLLFTLQFSVKFGCACCV